MATRRTTKTGLIVDAENNAPRRTTKLGLIVEYESFAPIVATEPATEVLEESTRVHGVVLADGGSDVEARFRYRAVGTATWTETAWQNTLATDDTYQEDLTGLDPSTEYEFQTQGTNSVGDGDWSDSETFETEALPSGGLWPRFFSLILTFFLGG